MATPSLAMIPSGYKATKLYSVLPNTAVGDFDVTRATTATRVNKSGLIEEVGVNVPRLDYTDGGCPVLLTEPQSTNLVTYSENFSDASWTAGGGGAFTITSNSGLSPNGELSASKLIASGVNYQDKQLIASINTQYTFSVWMKTSASSKDMRLFINDTDIASVVSVTDEWQRYEISGTTGGVLLGGGKTGFANVDILDESGFIYIWGAQLEQQSYATSYIKTSGATVTRNADVITVTPPSGVTEIIETIDGVEQAPITTIPSTYQVPNGNINKIIMQ